MFNLYAINTKTGRKVKTNAYPMTHSEACTFKSRFTPYPTVMLVLEGC